MFVPDRDEVTGDWRKLHNEELHNLHSSPNIIGMVKSRRMRWAGHVARMWRKRNTYRMLVGSDIGWGDMDWIDLAQDRDQWRSLVNTVLNLRVP
jgi:hypothetical protein